MAIIPRPRAVIAEDANPGFRAQMEDGWIVRDSFGGDPAWGYYGVRGKLIQLAEIQRGVIMGSGESYVKLMSYWSNHGRCVQDLLFE
jgi:hypothetical protein